MSSGPSVALSITWFCFPLLASPSSGPSPDQKYLTANNPQRKTAFPQGSHQKAWICISLDEGSVAKIMYCWSQAYHGSGMIPQRSKEGGIDVAGQSSK